MPLGRNLGPPTALDGLVDAQHNRGLRWHKGLEQQVQQNPAQLPTGPDRSIQHTVIVLKVHFGTQPHHPQGGTDRAFAGGQDRTDQEDDGQPPDALAEERGKRVPERV